MTDAAIEVTDLVKYYGTFQALKGLNLSRTDLFKTSLKKTNLAGCNLSQAYLRKADLTGANLEKANLRTANLRDADLSGANLNGADLRQAIFNSHTVLPFGREEAFARGMVLEEAERIPVRTV